jgi:hypothetical protein
MGITYGGKLQVPCGADTYPDGFAESLGLHTYHDSSWGKDISPFGGYVIMLCNGAVAWGSRKLRIVPDSTAEAETAVIAALQQRIQLWDGVYNQLVKLNAATKKSENEPALA